VLAAINLPIQTSLADKHGGDIALFAVIVPVLIVVIALTLLGPERHGVRFGSDPDARVAGSGRFTRTTEREPVGARN
jgi:SHS family lactate transporter-like MFS transporter